MWFIFICRWKHFYLLFCLSFIFYEGYVALWFKVTNLFILEQGFLLATKLLTWASKCLWPPKIYFIIKVCNTKKLFFCIKVSQLNNFYITTKLFTFASKYVLPQICLPLHQSVHRPQTGGRRRGPQRLPSRRRGPHHRVVHSQIFKVNPTWLSFLFLWCKSTSKSDLTSWLGSSLTTHNAAGYFYH